MLEPGQIFAGRYKVLRMIAPGGMGAVFEAQHTGTERHVALKLLWPQVIAVQSAREKFELEAKVAARVQSEHIVHVLDAGFDEASRSPYLVMELLHGGTLAAHVQKEGALGPDLTVALLGQVARGLDAAHGLCDVHGARAPIIHRDLKPENLILSKSSGALPLVKILDFGIAKVLSESRNVSREVRGTPLYMAYEQVAAEKLSPQTDIWALGLIAYYMLTGRSYWKSADDPEAGIAALFAEIITLPLAPASARLSEQGVRQPLPEAFDPWLTRCLDRIPERRFESAGAAVIALEAALRGSMQQPSRSGAPRMKLPELGSSRAPFTQSFVPAAAEDALRRGGSRSRMLGASSVASTATSLAAISSERLAHVRHERLPRPARSTVALTLGGVLLSCSVLAFAWLRRPSEEPHGPATVTPAAGTSRTATTTWAELPSVPAPVQEVAGTSPGRVPSPAGSAASGQGPEGEAVQRRPGQLGLEGASHPGDLSSSASTKASATHSKRAPTSAQPPRAPLERRPALTKPDRSGDRAPLVNPFDTR